MRKSVSHSALLERARCLDLANRPREALQAYSDFLDVEPDNADVWLAYGDLLKSNGDLKEAMRAFHVVLRLASDHPAALVCVANTLVMLDRIDEAKLINEGLLDKNPQDAGALLSLAGCFHKKGDIGRARALLEQLIGFQPQNDLARSLLNTIYIFQADWASLRENREQQLNRFSGLDVDFERSHLQLLFGEMPEGWITGEVRLRIPGKVLPRRSYQQPQWNGDAFGDRILLVHYEQGLGDTIMYVRYLPMVKALGGTVILMVQPELVELVSTCPGADQVIPDGSNIPPFDLHISLLSLPAVFRTELTSIPGVVPYLNAPSLVPNLSHISKVMATAKAGIRIGLVWAGNPNHKRDAERSIPVKALSPLNALSGIYWFSFQLGQRELPPIRYLLPLAPLLSNFSDTAYALSEMDLVITVDTALAHLAGAMNIPTWLLVDFEPDFRWMLGREDTPWYPSLRIYRQSSQGDWETVIHRVSEDLANSYLGHL